MNKHMTKAEIEWNNKEAQWRRKAHAKIDRALKAADPSREHKVYMPHWQADYPISLAVPHERIARVDL